MWGILLARNSHSGGRAAKWCDDPGCVGVIRSVLLQSDDGCRVNTVGIRTREDDRKETLEIVRTEVAVGRSVRVRLCLAPVDGWLLVGHGPIHLARDHIKLAGKKFPSN